MTICEPGDSTVCQTIDHVMVDTGSSGLRILSSALTTVSLNPELDASSNTIAECTVTANTSYAGGAYLYGEMATADIQIGEETASNVPVQLIGSDPDGWSPPADGNCDTGSDTNLTTAAQLGANGILGVGLFAQDCGTSCTGHAGNVIDSAYYGCSSSVQCTAETTALPASQQLTNPVTLFAQDNNGLIIELPAIPLTSGADIGAQTVTGQIVFGIGTASNNVISSLTPVPTVIPADATLGTIVTTYPSQAPNQTLSSSFLDTGANAYLFGNSSETTITQCTSTGDTGYYCPTSPVSSTATLTAAASTGSSATSTVNFSIANADTLNSGSNSAFDNLGGLLPGSYSADASSMFIWGMPFFYGRNVVIAFAGKNTSAGTGPYYAF